MAVEIKHGDCMEVLPTLAADSIDSCVTDPPYGLQFMGKKWDDESTIAFRPELWREVLRALKPGAHLLAFGGTRTYHRLACAVEDAGFEVRDAIMWHYSTGFPKNHRISRSIDDDELTLQWDGWGTALKPSVEVLVMAQKPFSYAQEWNMIGSAICKLWSRLWSMLSAKDAEGLSPLNPNVYGVDASAFAQWNAADASNTRDALCAQMGTSQFGLALISSLNTVSSWSGILAAASTRGSMSTTETGSSQTIELKTLRCCLSKITPESIILAHRSGNWSSADASSAERYSNACVAKWKSILELSAADSALSADATFSLDEGARIVPATEIIVLARKPLAEKTIAANVLAHGTGGLNIDGCRVGTEGGTEKGSKPTGLGNGIYGAGLHGACEIKHLDAGRWPANLIHDGSEEVTRLFPDVGGAGVVRELKRNAKPERCDGYRMDKGDTPPSGQSFADSGSAARFFYNAKADAGDRLGSKHPTVKPVDLIAYLCRLVTPPGGTVLDPFAGSGTTGMACLREGFNAVLIEREAEYVADIRRRLDHVVGLDTPLFDAPMTLEEKRQDSRANYELALEAMRHRNDK